MTKKEAASRVLLVARSIHHHSAGDEQAEVWIIQLLWLAEGLDPAILQHPAYIECLGEGDSRRTKLRRLIYHPATGAHEREAAVLALERINEVREPNDGDVPCADCPDPRSCAEDVCPDLLVDDSAPTDVEAWFEVDH